MRGFGLGLGLKRRATGAPAPPPVQTVNGTAIGGAGGVGTIFETFKLAAGDDFDTAPTRWAPVQNPTGSYAHSAMSNCFRGFSASDNSMFVDPYYRGARSESPTDLGFDRVSVASSVMSLTASAPDAGIVAYLPTTYTGGRGDGANKPKLLTGALKSAPSFMLSAQADFIVAFKIRCSGAVARGWWPGAWTTTFFWPDYGEVDVFEGLKNVSTGAVQGQQNYHVTAVDGGADVGGAVTNEVVPTTRFVQFVTKKSGTTLSFYDDAAVAGTLAFRGSTTTSVSRIRGAHDIRLDMGVATIHDSSTFTAGDWPHAIEFDYWQAWVPAAAGANSALNVLTAVNTTPGGAWTATLPAAATVSGGAAGIEQITGAFDSFDTPGMPTRDATTKLPGGMTINAGTRAVTGTVPATEGGRVGVLITYAFDDGTPAKRYMLPFNVAPAIQASFFANLTFNSSTAFSQSVAYTDFHSGNLGHTYTATSDKAWAVVTMAGDNRSFTVAGTTPGTSDTATITGNATNSAGQSTPFTRTIVSNAISLSDTFTGTTGSSLTAHTADVGGAWSLQTGVASNGTPLLSSAGRTYTPSGTAFGVVQNAASMGSGNVYAELDVFRLSSLAGEGGGVALRMAAGAATFYAARWDNTSATWAILKSVAGTVTNLGNAAGTTPSAVAIRLRFEVTGTTNPVLTLKLNGSTVVGPITDTGTVAALQGGGGAGLRLVGKASAGAADTTGMHFDNLIAGSL